MIKVIAKKRIKPDQRDAYIARARRLVEDTRQKDAGCIRYELLQDVEDPNVLTFLEEWESEQALRLHGQAPHFRQAMEDFAGMAQGPADVNRYEVLA
jgi:quinol monooxygenase YgiN